MIVEITLPAFEDLENIRNYIKKDSSFYSNVYIEKILDSIAILQDFPEIGRIVPEFNEQNIREKIFGNYRIIYEITTKQINIIAVIHGARNIKKIIKKEKPNHPAHCRPFNLHA
jgi:toxin ParE1/3/4